MSERISWTTCPHCGGAAAVGWLQDDPIEFDCAAGCTVRDLPLAVENWLTSQSEWRRTRPSTEAGH
jgi:hypothetical protein